MRFLHRLTAVCLLAPALVRPCSGQGSAFEVFSPEHGVARAADADRDGGVTSEEWSGFLDSLAAGEGGLLDADRVLARLLIPRLDADDDGRFTRADVELRLKRLDADGSGSIEPAEMLGVVQTFGGRFGNAADKSGEALLDGLIAFGADADENRTLEPEEWRAASAAASTGEEVPVPTVAAWISWAERFVPEERRAFAPGTLTLTLRAGLDANQDGRSTLDDLARLFTRVDADQSGSLSADEVARSLEAQRRGTGAVTAAETTPAPDVTRPPLMPWQRSLEDALALSRASGKPLLLCVNMDSEPASDLLALGRYRDPAFVQLVEGFVPLLASPDRHRPRDRDGANRRLSDPRFGRLVEDEHIAIEPVLFERYFDGRRVAPRHVGVAPDGTILFDLYLLQDLRAVDEALRTHGRPEAPWTDVETLDEEGLLASPDAAARERLEGLFQATDDETRLRLVRRALDPQRATQQPELVRLALRDPFPGVRLAALEAVAAQPLALPLEVFPEALRVAAAAGRDGAQLAAALERRVAEGPANEVVRARRLARLARAAARPSSAIDVELWRALLEGAPSAAAPALDDGVFERLAAIEALVAGAPEDGRLVAAQARAALDAALQMMAQGGGNPSFLLQDAEDAARRAAARDPQDSLAWAVLAQAAFQLSDFQAAGDAALLALPGLLGWAESARAADVLDVLARSRTRQLYEQLGGDAPWPMEWVADSLAAYQVLLVHPLGSEAQAVAALDLLGNLELFALQGPFLRSALARWPLSAALHNYYRWTLLRDGGPAALVAGYQDLDLGTGYEATALWYGGLAAIVAAERRVEDGDVEHAFADYERAIGELEASIAAEPAYESTARYYVALARAGLARLHLEQGQLDQALEDLRASALAQADGLGADGLGRTRAQTARSLRRALDRAGREAEAAELDVLTHEGGESG